MSIQSNKEVDHIMLEDWTFFLFFSLFIFRERGKEGERKGEKHWCVREMSIGCFLDAPAGHLARNPGMCPDWASNQWPFALWDDAQPTEPHQSGQERIAFIRILSVLTLTCLPFSKATCSSVKGQKSCLVSAGIGHEYVRRSPAQDVSEGRRILI